MQALNIAAIGFQLLEGFMQYVWIGSQADPTGLPIWIAKLIHDFNGQFKVKLSWSISLKLHETKSNDQLKTAQHAAGDFWLHMHFRIADTRQRVV